MPHFESCISNGKHSVGCTGRTVYLFDPDDNVLAKFRDLTYAYVSAFSPDDDIFAVKSTVGRLAIYSADERRLIKKFRFTKMDHSQNDMFCFSPDGELFYNIERHGDYLNSLLAVYRADDFTLQKQLFSDEPLDPKIIEFDTSAAEIYIMGYERDRDGFIRKYFVAKLVGDELRFKEPITEREYDFYWAYKHVEAIGYLGEAKNWSGCVYAGFDFSKTEPGKHSLSKLWHYYRQKRAVDIST